MLQQIIDVNIWQLLVIMTRIGTMLSLVPGFGAEVYRAAADYLIRNRGPLLSGLSKHSQAAE